MSNEKILIIRLTSLGDVIFSIPLACALKNSPKSAKIGWLVAEKGLSVIENNPCVDKVHFIPLKEWKKRPFSLLTFREFFQIISEIRKEKYDIAFDCQQMFKSLFLFWFSGAKRRITYKGARELSSFAGNELISPKFKFEDPNYHIVERNLDFARYLGIEPEKVTFSLPESSADTKMYVDNLLDGLDKSKPNVIISPATTWENKHWSELNWAQLIDEIYDRCNIIFTGTSFDWQLIAKILAKTKKQVNYLNLAGKTDVEQLRELFTRAKIVISPDSGSAHLAWASQVPSVVTIFTCTPEKRFGPYDYDSGKYFSISGSEENSFPADALKKEMPCKPCFKRKCKLKREKNICRNYPKPAEIINIVNQIL